MRLVPTAVAATAALLALSACSGTATTVSSSAAPTSTTATTTSQETTTTTATETTSVTPTESETSSAEASTDSASPSTESSTDAGPGEQVDATELASRIQKGMAAIKTSHSVITIKTASGNSTTDVVSDMTDRANLKTKATSTVEGVSVLMVMVDKVVYMSEDGGKTFTKRPATEADLKTNNDKLSTLFKSGTKATAVGKDDKGTHYKVTLDGKAVGTGQDMPADVWVDDKDRVTSMSYRVTFQGAQSTSQVTNDKFDEPVTITAPPASQVKG